jgi:hypothetical protein
MGYAPRGLSHGGKKRESITVLSVFKTTLTKTVSVVFYMNALTSILSNGRIFPEVFKENSHVSEFFVAYCG